MVNKLTGPLQTHEIEYAEKLWIKIIQETAPSENQMNKIMDNDGIWRINSRMHVYSSVLLPRTGDFRKMLIEDHHQRSLHGGVRETMCDIRERFWISKLRGAIKAIIYNFNLCKRYRQGPLKPQATGNLPKFHCELGEPFQRTEIDFAGPLIYKVGDQEMKRYIVTLTCATTKAVHLKLAKSVLTEQLKYTLKELIARRWTPRTIISDSLKTFKAASNWRRRSFMMRTSSTFSIYIGLNGNLTC